jgi:hypothetical protein
MCRDLGIDGGRCHTQELGDHGLSCTTYCYVENPFFFFLIPLGLPTVGSVHFSGPDFILPGNIQVVNPVILAEVQLGVSMY